MSTLQNFGVPIDGKKAQILQPKYKNRFRVILTNFGVPTGSVAITANVVSCGSPSVSFDPVMVDSYMSKAYFVGKPTWETIELVLRDDVSNSCTELVGAQLQKQMNFFTQTGALSGANYKFQMELDTMDGGDTGVLETWELEGCMIANAKYGDKEYSTADTVTISLTIRFDNATQTNGLMPINPIFTNPGDPFIA